jgi:hypothetical protein
MRRRWEGEIVVVGINFELRFRNYGFLLKYVIVSRVSNLKETITYTPFIVNIPYPVKVKQYSRSGRFSLRHRVLPVLIPASKEVHCAHFFMCHSTCSFDQEDSQSHFCLRRLWR